MRPGTELEHPRQGRAPQHERGRRRVDAILDAASALLVEGGLAAVSVDAVAKRSRTSKSSMYHFFPDRDAIVRALADRHVAAITATGEGFETVDAPSWARATVEQVVDRYIAQFARYVAAHPDVLLCMQANAGLSGAESAEAGLEAMALKRAEFVGGARLPHARPAERRARAATLYAVTIGTMEVMSRLRSGRPSRAAAIRELRQVLIAYLARIEADVASR